MSSQESEHPYMLIYGAEADLGRRWSFGLPFLPAPRCYLLLHCHSSRIPQRIPQSPPQKTDHDAPCGYLLAYSLFASCSSNFGSLSTWTTVQHTFFTLRPPTSLTLRRPRSQYRGHEKDGSFTAPGPDEKFHYRGSS